MLFVVAIFHARRRLSSLAGGTSQGPEAGPIPSPSPLHGRETKPSILYIINKHELLLMYNKQAWLLNHNACLIKMVALP